MKKLLMILYIKVNTFSPKRKTRKNKSSFLVYKVWKRFGCSGNLSPLQPKVYFVSEKSASITESSEGFAPGDGVDCSAELYTFFPISIN